MRRREFLHPRRLARGVGQVVAALAPEVEANPLPAEAALVRASRRAMATIFEVLLPLGLANSHEIAAAALDEIDRHEAQLTIYREGSEVSQLNRTAFERPMRVDAGLFRLLTLSDRLTTATEGAFDVSAGALSRVWGFVAGPRRVPEEAELAAALERVGMRHVHLDPENDTVRYHRPGLEINLGSIGKGWALDRLAETLSTLWGVRCALLHGGHSSINAVGTPPNDPRGWLVGIRHPWYPDRHLALLRLRGQALGTSAATFQHLEYNGQKLGHILDPRTGWPAAALASASVLAPTAAEADALATAFFIQGSGWAADYCKRHPETGAVVLPPGPAARPICYNLTADQRDGVLSLKESDAKAES